MAIDPDQTICDNLEKPKKGQNGMGMFEQHSLPDQIKAAQYLENSNVGETGKTKFLGVLLRQFSLPGTV